MYDLALKDGLISFDDLLDIDHSFLLIKGAFFFYFLGQSAKLTVLRNNEHLLVPWMLGNDLKDVIPTM